MILRFILLIRLLLIIKNSKNSSTRQYAALERLVMMGGVYVKFAQLMLVQMQNESPSAYDNRFELLLHKTYDQVFTDTVDISRLLQQELGHKAHQLHDLDTTPFASGSFGQVYRARLDNGSQVIVKVLKPSVLNTIHKDLQLIGILAFVSKYIDTKGLDISQIFNEFKTLTLKEIDYTLEAFTADKIYREQLDEPQLVIPKTYLELCTKHIIVQEELTGLTMTQVLEAKHQGHNAVDYVKSHIGSDLVLQMQVMGKNMLFALLEGKMSHGDPHPGNIILLPHNKIGLIDFGISSTGPTNKHAFYNFVKQYSAVYNDQGIDVRRFTITMIDLFANDLMSAIRTLDKYNQGRSSTYILDALASSAEQIFEESQENVNELLDNNKIMRIFSQVINDNNRFGLHIKLDEPEYLRASWMCINLVETLGIKYEVLPSIYMSTSDHFKDFSFAPKHIDSSPESALSDIAIWLEQIASRDIILYRFLSYNINRSALYV